MKRMLEWLFPSCKTARSGAEFCWPRTQSGPPIYRTNEKIEGEVIFTPDHDMSVHTLQIIFEGTVIAGIEAPVSNAWASHEFARKMFLRVYESRHDSIAMNTMTLHAGSTYRLPFLFVVPAELLPQACVHDHKHPEIRLQHLQLPPSLFSNTRIDGTKALSDSGPDSVSVNYAIRFRVTEIKSTAEEPSIVVDEAQNLFILPTIPEAPPILVPEDSTLYNLSKEIIITSLRGKKLGRLSASANQPRAIQLGNDQSQLLNSTSTMMGIDLWYSLTDSHQSLPMPKIIQTQLNIITFYGTEPWVDLPEQIGHGSSNPCHRSYYQMVPLSILDITAVKWDKSPLGNSSSAGRSRRAESEDLAEVERESYTASISLPIVLPQDAIHTPTFYSCLISRIYSIRVIVTFDLPRLVPVSSTLSLTVPIQIAPSPSTVTGTPNS